MLWVGQKLRKRIGGCAHIEDILHGIAKNTPLHAHGRSSGRGESGVVIPRGHGMKTVSGSIRWHTVPLRGTLFIAHVWT